MPVETATARTITCDNPACPVVAGKEKLPEWMSPDDVHGWVFVRVEHGGIATVEYVCCGQACASEVAASVGEIRGTDKTGGDPGETVTLTGHGFKDAHEVLVGGVEADFNAKSDKTLTLTVPAGGPGPIAILTEGPAIISGFQFDTTQPDPEEDESGGA